MSTSVIVPVTVLCHLFSPPALQQMIVIVPQSGSRLPRSLPVPNPLDLVPPPVSLPAPLLEDACREERPVGRDFELAVATALAAVPVVQHHFLFVVPKGHLVAPREVGVLGLDTEPCRARFACVVEAVAQDCQDVIVVCCGTKGLVIQR